MLQDWERIVRRLTEDDGAVVDVFAEGVGSSGWQALLDLPREKGWVYKYTEDGRHLPVPSPQVIRDHRSTVFCAFEFEPTPGLSISTAFFDSENIELWFDPRCLTSAADVSSLWSFVRMLGRRLGTTVLVTVSDHPEWVYLRFDIERDEVVEVDR